MRLGVYSIIVEPSWEITFPSDGNECPSDLLQSLKSP
jgi:hypothetical protein